MPDNKAPEKFIYDVLVNIPGMDDPELSEIITVAKEIGVLADSHDYISTVIERLGWDRRVGLSKIVDIIATSEVWEDYTSEIREWLESKKEFVDEISQPS